MSSRDKRLCPGVDGRKCGAYMSPVFRDPHPTCARCRGRNCAGDSMCSSYQDWSLAQWEAFHAKRSYTDHKKSNSRHAGGPTSLTSKSPLSSAPVKQAAPSLAPPPLSAPPPPPLEGSGIGEETKSDNPKQTRVSSSPPLLASQQRERWGDTDNELTEQGNTPPPPPPLRRGEGWMPAPLSQLPYYLRLCSRLGLTATLLTPTRSPTRGVREARVAPTLPLPSSNAFKAERGQVATHGQRNHGRGTSVPILRPRATCGPLDRTDILLSVRPLTRCPLDARPLGPGRQLSSRGHRDSTRDLRSGRAWNRTPFIKVRRGPTGNTRSSMTHYCSHMPTLTRIGNKAAPTTACGRGNLCHTTRIPRERGTRVTERPGMPTATN